MGTRGSFPGGKVAWVRSE